MNPVTVCSFLFTEAIMYNGMEVSVKDAMLEFQRYCGWTEDDYPVQTLRRKYYHMRPIFYKHRHNLKAESSSNLFASVLTTSYFAVYLYFWGAGERIAGNYNEEEIQANFKRYMKLN